MIIALLIAVVVLFTAFILAAHSYNKLYEKRDRLEIENNNLHENNAELVTMVTELRYRYGDFDVYKSNDGRTTISCGTSRLIGPQRTEKPREVGDVRLQEIRRTF